MKNKPFINYTDNSYIRGEVVWIYGENFGDKGKKSRVYLIDAIRMQDAGILIDQSIVKWSNTLIKVVASVDPIYSNIAYIVVINEDNERNETGYPVAIFNNRTDGKSG